MDLRHELNNKQLKAVQTLEGPVLVLSSAGSGKTRIITYRVANMIEEGIDPADILTVTFTNKAAQEMTGRTKELTDHNLSGLWMGTFHAIGCRILRENLEHLGYGRSFSIYDQTDSTNLLEKIMGDNNLSEDRIKPEKLQQIISSLKRNMKSPSNYLADLKKEDVSIDKYNQQIAECYQDYEEILKRDYVFDFEDLIKKPIELLINNKDIREHYQEKFKYIQVDEYQDINNSQYVMTKLLARPQNNLLVVGDEDQCQPPGANILTTRGYKDIEDIDPNNDKLVSYAPESSYVMGIDNGYNFEKAKRDYTGQLYTIKTENGKTSKCTYNHKWIIKSLKKPDRNRNALYEVPACNIIPGLMKIPVHKGGRDQEWVKITEIKKEHYDGPVYSLNVDKYHKYISNEMVTCNSIYRFRGAELQNILNFQDEYQNAEIIKMETNYRSTENIVNASNAMIKQNKERIGKTAQANKGTGDQIVFIENKSPQAEGQFIADLTLRLTALDYEYKEIAVLYRSHFQSEPIETKLMENGIPYQVISSHRFFDREEIKNFIGILRFLNNPNDNLALVNVMKIFNNSVGSKLIGRMVNHARSKSIKLIDIIPNADVIEGIGPKRSNALQEFYNEYLMPSIEIINKEDIDLSEKIDRIYHDVFDYNKLLTKYDNPKNRKENLQQLLNYIALKHKEGNDLVNILQNIKLAGDQDDPRDNDDNSVNLMTMHASKGTEHPVVIVIGMEENIMPHVKSTDTLEEIEEERRLFYVAMTRAEDKLFLSRCHGRLKFGEYVQPAASRFLEEIPVHNYKRVSNF